MVKIKNDKENIVLLEDKFNIKPRFNLATGPGWIQVEYTNGEKDFLNLQDVFLKTTEIKRISLGLPFSTAILHKIFVIIAYRFFEEELEEYDSEKSWDAFREKTIIENKGFGEKQVREYFEEFNDRFYLIHPKMAFLQDSSLLCQENNKKFLGNLSNIDPTRITIKPADVNKVIWGLPKENVVNNNMSESENVSKLVSLLFYQVFGYSAVAKSPRTFIDEPNIEISNYPKIAPLRAAVHWIVHGDNFFETLMLSLLYYNLNDFDDDEFKNDVPIWEKEVNSYGFLDKNGLYHNGNEHYVLNGHRSFINNFQLGLVFLHPDCDTNNIEDDFSEIKVYRSVNSVLDERMTPAYDPYTALKTRYDDNNNVIKNTFNYSESIYDNNILKLNNIYSTTFNLKDDVENPPVIQQFINSNFKNIIYKTQNIEILIQSEQIAQDNKVAGVKSIILPDFYLQEYLTNQKNINNLDSWKISRDISNLLKKNVFKTISNSDSADYSSYSKVFIDDFWVTVNDFFDKSLYYKSVEPIYAYKKELLSFVEKKYRILCEPYVSINPVGYAKNLKSLYKNVYKLL